MENVGVAIMTAVNELARRHGIKPYEFVAVLDTKPQNHTEIELRFESPPEQDKTAAFERMLADLGASTSGDDMPRLRGTDEAIYKSLETALKRAPRASRTR